MKKILHHSVLCLCAALLFAACTEDDTATGGQSSGPASLEEVPANEEVNAAIFEALNLDYPGLERVKSYYEADEYYRAAQALLEYYRSRTEVSDPDVNLLSPVITAEQQQQADWALSANNYRFYVAGYADPSAADGAPYTYMKEKAVDWTFCGSGEDAERYGLHRHAWFLPQALAYRTSHDETYVKEWMNVYGDWLAKHAFGAETESNAWAWRSVDVAARVKDQCAVMLYTMQSVNFTPQWAATFLSALVAQSEMVAAELADPAAVGAYTTEEVAMLLAQSLGRVGKLFPELKLASAWRSSAVEVLNQGIDPTWFEAVNLDYPALSKARTAYDAGDYYAAAEAVLNYYRNRTSVINPDVNLENPSITAEQQLYADYALRENGYRFYVKNYYENTASKIPYSYMNEEGGIDWQYWPTGEQEHRYQLHRHMWMIHQAKAYYISKNETYVKDWMEVFCDWFRQNPCPEVDIDFSQGPWGLPDELKNYGWTWRSLDVAARLIDHCAVLEYVKGSASLTPAFWMEFLYHLASEADHISENYSADSNHLITQAQAVTEAGVLLPELKNADLWVASGAGKLNETVASQYYADGWLMDGDFHYHISSIEDFRSAMYVAQLNGRDEIFPAEYKESLRGMVEVVKHMIYPDYSSVNMADTRKSTWSKSVLKKNLSRYVELFPEDAELLWLATEGAQGTLPTAYSKGFSDCGYYVLRSGWTASDIMMVVGNATQTPSEKWHRQWDNGTFELYVKGRQFFPDSGCYTYDTGSTRRKYAATTAHNTLTLNGEDIAKCRGELLRLDNNKGTERLVIKNPSYDGLTHRRSIFFVDRSFFVVVDEAYGSKTGTLNLNFNMGESTSDHVLDAEALGAHTTFSDGNNLLVRSFSESALTFVEREGFYSHTINQSVPRKAWQVNAEKSGADAVRFITVIYPTADATTPTVEASFSGSWSASRVAVNVKINGKEYSLVNSNLTE